MIERVKLYELEIVEIDGEFKQVKRNEEVRPCMLTNHSLYVGKRDGILDASLTEELYKIVSVFEDKGVKPDEIKEEDLEEYGTAMFKGLTEIADEDKITKIIYLGLVGANPKLEYDFEGFILRYHGDFEEKMELYVSLITNLITHDNKFKKEFEDKTKIEVGKKK